MWSALLVVAPTLCACATPTAAPARAHFLRGAIQHADGRIESRAWRPGEVVDGATAPVIAECRPVFQVQLEDRTADAEQGVPPAGVAMAFAPDGGRLALGTVEGDVRVVAVPSGALIAERQLAEGAVKALAFNADGTVLYVGEQSPDAYLYALEPSTLATRWQKRLADDLETSVIAADNSMYGRFSLPGAYAVRVLEGGDLIVAGAHGWPVDGGRRNRTRLWRLAPDGAVVAAYPADGAADASFLFPAVTDGPDGGVLVGVSRSASGPPPADLPIGGLIDLALADLRPRWTRTFPPLEPWFKEVFFWEAVARTSGFAFAGLGDGRAFLLGPDGSVRQALEPGVPVETAGIPIGVGVGFATANADGAWFLTTSTNIPWGSADPAARPPAAHPAQDTVHAVGPDGAARWDRALPHAVGGIVLSPAGDEVLVGAGPRDVDQRADLYGAVVLAAATGDLVTTCATAGPVDFRPVYAPGGDWIALAEAPWKTADGTIAGAYRVTVFR